MEVSQRRGSTVVRIERKRGRGEGGMGRSSWEVKEGEATNFNWCGFKWCGCFSTWYPCFWASWIDPPETCIDFAFKMSSKESLQSVSLVKGLDSKTVLNCCSSFQFWTLKESYFALEDSPFTVVTFVSYPICVCYSLFLKRQLKAGHVYWWHSSQLILRHIAMLPIHSYRNESDLNSRTNLNVAMIYQCCDGSKMI